MLPINLPEKSLLEGEEPRPRRKERDTANPISGHYFVLRLTVNKGVEDGWGGPGRNRPSRSFSDFLAAFSCTRRRRRRRRV